MDTYLCACAQMRSSDNLDENVQTSLALLQEAADRGASLFATPEMTGLLDIRPGGMRSKVVVEEEDACLAAMRQGARQHQMWVLIGSLAIVIPDTNMFANRSFLIDPDGQIQARYDKIHMFDVDVGDGQSYHESKGYRPGEQAVTAQTPLGVMGMSICYDLRFAALYRALAQAGAQILTVPAAFTRVTGEAHWEVLLRARAIETGSYVIAPAQGGKHADGRETYGHAMIISPWGEVLACTQNDDAPQLITAQIDLGSIELPKPAARCHRSPTTETSRPSDKSSGQVSQMNRRQTIAGFLSAFAPLPAMAMTGLHTTNRFYPHQLEPGSICVWSVFLRRKGSRSKAYPPS